MRRQGSAGDARHLPNAFVTFRITKGESIEQAIRRLAQSFGVVQTETH